MSANIPAPPENGKNVAVRAFEGVSPAEEGFVAAFIGRGRSRAVPLGWVTIHRQWVYEPFVSDTRPPAAFRS